MYSQLEGYIESCYHRAQASDDPNTQVGAVLINEYGSAVYSACNSFPIGVKISKKRLKRPTKYFFMEHAETGLIHAAAKRGIKTDGMSIACPWYPCADCAKAIINAGIVRMIHHKTMLELTPIYWKESIEYGQRMLKEAGVSQVIVDQKFNMTVRHVDKDIIV